jgi:deoxyribose-phosphate aldolase
MPPATFEEFARLLDLSLLSPSLDNHQLVAGMDSARRSGIASAIVRPCDVDLGVRQLQGGSVRCATVVSYPFGLSNTATKLYETRDLLRRGAKEIGLTVAVSKLLSREFQYVQTELLQLAEICHNDGATISVAFDTSYLNRELVIIACTCCERAEVDLVRTTSIDDLPLLRKHLPDETALALDGLESVDSILQGIEAGAARFATTSAAAILAEWKTRLQPAASPTVS